MILNVALGIALVFLCYLVTIGKGKEKEQEQEQKQDSSEVVINNILQRTSIRSYEDRPVEKEKIEKLLRAGMAAPTAVNKQPWHFIVVTDKDQLQKLAEANPNAGMAAKAPLAIVVCGDMNKALEGDAREFGSRIALQPQRIFSWQPQEWDLDPCGQAPIRQRSAVMP